jgi:hypothetical protein
LKNFPVNPVLERAGKLRHQADIVLEKLRLFEILQHYGKVYPTGSYFLDVMAYPDIDLYIANVNREQIFAIGAELARHELVTQVVFEKTNDPLQMPEGLYLKVRVIYGDWGRPWKVDIWSLDEKIIRDKLADMQHFRERLTPAIREQIIRYKLSVLTAEKRTPMYSGYFIYKAFIDQGMTEFESVTRYLLMNHIQVKDRGVFSV